VAASVSNTVAASASISATRAAMLAMI
jgi:hypothetical protein